MEIHVCERKYMPVKQVADLFFPQISDLRYSKPVKQVADLFFPQISDLRYSKPVKQVADLFTGKPASKLLDI
jgi:hypothetical protein